MRRRSRDTQPPNPSEAHDATSDIVSAKEAHDIAQAAQAQKDRARELAAKEQSGLTSLENSWFVGENELAERQEAENEQTRQENAGIGTELDPYEPTKTAAEVAAAPSHLVANSENIVTLEDKAQRAKLHEIADNIRSKMESEALNDEDLVEITPPITTTTEKKQVPPPIPKAAKQQSEEPRITFPQEEVNALVDDAMAEAEEKALPTFETITDETPSEYVVAGQQVIAGESKVTFQTNKGETKSWLVEEIRRDEPAERLILREIGSDGQLTHRKTYKSFAKLEADVQKDPTAFHVEAYEPSTASPKEETKEKTSQADIASLSEKERLALARKEIAAIRAQEVAPAANNDIEFEASDDEEEVGPAPVVQQPPAQSYAATTYTPGMVYMPDGTVQQGTTAPSSKQQKRQKTKKRPGFFARLFGRKKEPTHLSDQQIRDTQETLRQRQAAGLTRYDGGDAAAPHRRAAAQELRKKVAGSETRYQVPYAKDQIPEVAPPRIHEESQDRPFADAAE